VSLYAQALSTPPNNVAIVQSRRYVAVGFALYHQGAHAVYKHDEITCQERFYEYALERDGLIKSI
jgi:hypothetical protein